jgi:hypothetical protein
VFLKDGFSSRGNRAAVAETILPHHTVEMSRDNNGVLGLQTGNRLQRRYVLRGPNPEDDFSVSAPLLPDEPEEHIRIHFASENEVAHFQSSRSGNARRTLFPRTGSSDDLTDHCHSRQRQFNETRDQSQIHAQRVVVKRCSKLTSRPVRFGAL